MEGELGALPGWPLHLSWPPLQLRSQPAFLREGIQPDVPSWLTPWVLVSASILVDAKDSRTTIAPRSITPLRSGGPVLNPAFYIQPLWSLGTAL